MGIVVLAACGLLLVRLWVLPNIDRWRDDIAHQLSEASGLSVQLGEINAQWTGGAPTFAIDSVTVSEPSRPDVPVASSGRIDGAIQLESLWTQQPRFDRLSIDQLDLTVERLDARTYVIAGRRIDIDPDAATSRLSDYALVQWLGLQQAITVSNARATWVDHLNQAPSLSVSPLGFSLTREDDHVLLALDAQADTQRSGLGGPLRVRARVADGFFNASNLSPNVEQGEVRFEMNEVQIEAYKPWLPVGLTTGLMDVDASLALVDGKVGPARATLSLDRFAWRDARVGLAALDQGTFALSGSLGDWFPRVEWLSRNEQAEDVTLDADVTGLDLHFPDRFAGPAWHAHKVALRATGARDDAQHWRVAVSEGHIESDDLTARIQGHWQQDDIDPLGTAAFSVDFARADLSAIYRYVPDFVDIKVRDWLEYGLVEGEARQAHLEMAGRLDDFPFNAAPGHFKVGGKIQDATVDYLPDGGGFAALAAGPRGGPVRWPRIERINGSFDIDKTALTVRAGAGTQLQSVGHDPVHVSDITAHIADMAHNALLVIDAKTNGRAQGYIDVVNHSPLSSMINDGLRAAKGSGEMTMPLTMSIPLTKASQLAARADLQFRNVGLAFEGVPRIEAINGHLVVTRPTIRVEKLSGQWLGGPVALTGRIGGGGAGIRLAGSAQMSALQRWQGNNAPIWKRFTGATNYTAHIGYGVQDVINVDVQSDMVGIGLDLPEPFAKQAATALPVHVAWRPEATGTRVKRATLNVDVGERATLTAAVSGTENQPLTALDRAAVGVNRPVHLPDTGVQVDVQVPQIDLAAWRAVLADVQTSEPDAAPSDKALDLSNQPLVLNVDTDRLNAGRVGLTDFKLRAQRSGRGASQKWLARLGSEQAQGTIQWHDGPSHSAGALVARLSRLAVERSDSPDSDEKAAQLSDHAAVDLAEFPAVDIAIDEFSFDGKPLGTVNLVGTNVEQGRRWRLDTLTVNNAAARLDAQGYWTARGADRGLSADAVVQLRDAGAMLGRLGHPNVMDRGAGTIKGRLTWRDSPWRHELRDIDGDLIVDIKSGRFLDVTSGSAKVLEVLSLQSLSRIVQLKANPGEVAKDGFPFDEIQSHLRVDKGVVIVDDYVINGPVARIKLVGESDFAAQTWDIKATVIPNLDVSGAALATGFIVNPVVGVGAFLAQWALRNPVEAAMTQRYRVTGPWDAPDVLSLEKNGQVKDGGVTNRRRNTEHITP